MLHLRQAMLDIIFFTVPVEDVMEGILMLLLIGELDAIIGQDGVGCCKARPQSDCAGIGQHSSFRLW